MLQFQFSLWKRSFLQPSRDYFDFLDFNLKFLFMTKKSTTFAYLKAIYMENDGRVSEGVQENFTCEMYVKSKGGHLSGNYCARLIRIQNVK